MCITRRNLFFGVASLIFWVAVSLAAGGPIDYRVGEGDLLEVNVLEEKEFSGAFRVGSDGTIDYPYLRKIEVRGKTTEELGALLTERLKDGYLASPQVAVEVKDYQSQKVLVLGAVRSPGMYILRENTRILDMVSKAGGISAEGGKQILLLRNTQNAGPPLSVKATPEPTKAAESEEEKAKAAMSSAAVKPLVLDYFRLAHEGDLSQNLLLQNGDVLNVPKANEIFVLGMVGRPGPIKYEENMGLLQAVTLAGGPTPVASTKSTYVLRQTLQGEKKIKVRLDKIMENEEKNFILTANDVIVVPESFF